VPESVLIIDSFSSLCIKDERTNDINKVIMGGAQKLIAKFLRRLNQVLQVNRNILIGITHISPNISGYGAAWVENSGMKLGYQVDYKLWAKSSKPWKLNEDGQQIGQEIEWDIVTSGISGTGNKAISFLRYGE